MRAELIGVGTELLLGQIPNSNARWMSERLAGAGIDVMHHQVVGDNLDRIVEAFRLAMSRADVVISTGGLGPTRDDITRDALASAVGAPLERDPQIEELLRAKFDRIGREMPESNLRQAEVPAGARYIEPRRGTAPGLIVEREGVMVYAVPGVPAEMVEMMEGTILPELAERSGGVIVSQVVRSTGIAESKVDEMLADLFEAGSQPSVAFLASAGEVKVRLTAKGSTREEAEAVIAPVLDEVARRVGSHCFTRDDEELEEVVGRLLREADLTVACAESLTGGSVAARITSVPGASYYFLGGAVCYTPEAKERVLGVSHQTLLQQGVVSEGVAREMAAGARRVFGADVAVGLTGAAGPTPHEGAEPGSVWVAIEAEGVSHARRFRSPGSREQVRRWSEQAALDLIRRHLEDLPFPD